MPGRAWTSNADGWLSDSASATERRGVTRPGFLRHKHRLPNDVSLGCCIWNVLIVVRGPALCLKCCRCPINAGLFPPVRKEGHRVQRPKYSRKYDAKLKAHCSLYGQIPVYSPTAFAVPTIAVGGQHWTDSILNSTLPPGGGLLQCAFGIQFECPAQSNLKTGVRVLHPIAIHPLSYFNCTPGLSCFPKPPESSPAE